MIVDHHDGFMKRGLSNLFNDLCVKKSATVISAMVNIFTREGVGRLPIT